MGSIARSAKRNQDSFHFLVVKKETKPIWRWHRCLHGTCDWKAISMQLIKGDVQKVIQCQKCKMAVEEEAKSTADPLQEDTQFITLCWLKPNVQQFLALPKHIQDYVRNGGLLMGRVSVQPVGG